MTTTHGAIAVTLVLSGFAYHAPHAQEPAALTSNVERVAAMDAAYRATRGDDANVLLRPGLIADRSDRTVRLVAEATGVEANEPIEFLLVGPGSSHGYESSARSFAMPSAVDEGLRFIGMTPGRRADASALAFWPKGERVQVTLQTVETNHIPEPIPLEHLVWGNANREPMREAGFVYVDPVRVNAPGATNNGVPAADSRDPHAIIVTYNEPTAILDVPRVAMQGAVYGQQTANAANLLPAGTLLMFTLRPERDADAQPRILNARLLVEPGTNGADAVYTLEVVSGGAVVTRSGPESLRLAVDRLCAGARDPFTTVRLSNDLTLGAAHTVGRLLDGLENEDGLRIEPPETGQLFYRAFLPDESNREPEDRVAQPWELHLERVDGAIQATLRRITTSWEDDQPDPILDATDYPLEHPGGLPGKLAELGPGMPVILVFAPPELRFDEMMAYIGPVMDTHGLVHVYLEPPPQD